jgi:hypothetical protein
MRFAVAQPVDLLDNAAALPTTPQQAHSHNRSGQLIWLPEPVNSSPDYAPFSACRIVVQIRNN